MCTGGTETVTSLDEASDFVGVQPYHLSDETDIARCDTENGENEYSPSLS